MTGFLALIAIEFYQNNIVSKTINSLMVERVYGFNVFGYNVPIGTVSFDNFVPSIIYPQFSFNNSFLAGSAHTPFGDFGIVYSINEFVVWDINTGNLTSKGVVNPPLGEWTGMTYDPVTGKLLL
ncbi:MAG: hypothetical protein QXP78_05125, partial [Candidatus Bathyarchaeia archaeon]